MPVRSGACVGDRVRELTVLVFRQNVYAVYIKIKNLNLC